MKKFFLRIYIASVLLAILLQFIMLLSGCGNDADDLYTDGKRLINNEKTRGDGLENLILFEQKFPDDPRAPEVVLATATLYHSQKNYAEAIGVFERLIEKYPESREAYKAEFLLGYIYCEELQETEKATDIFNNFIKTYPDSELTISAKILLENVNIPVEEWSIVKELELTGEKESNTQSSKIVK